ncbi:hypothetical protein EDB29_1011141 [Vibrio crassostreae]|uniref:hypothetical protein n=1 Tax=Vibrio crassostreae TaxID=246167 RepID=UPI001048360B|nr:hypothetical protein [Vibrio crassostreae]CAH6850023.1 hypothetical protein VCHA34P121_10454 [Vibrio chagasii]TCT44329.1 hypothetical protein EDB29_1011141 [Vibrio crassostreae]CAH6861484.1 hypothetical protein VCHA28FP16_10793 [Vibrio chagasii]CAH6924583.1 hypothetical protein VCHA48P437_100109 [Vibrio chagasii]CAH6943315.1 hypothetical protein VCHA44O286_110109 [Vibrio chagasii]
MCTKCLAKIAELIEGGIVNLETAGCKVIFPKMALIDELSAITYDTENKQLIISELPEKLIEEVEGYLESKQPQKATQESSSTDTPPHATEALKIGIANLERLIELEKKIGSAFTELTKNADSGVDVDSKSLDLVRNEDACIACRLSALDKIQQSVCESIENHIPKKYCQVIIGK